MLLSFILASAVFKKKKKVTFGGKCHSYNITLLNCYVTMTVASSDSTLTPEMNGGGQLSVEIKLKILCKRKYVNMPC